MRRYAEVSRRIRALLLDVTPFVEPISIDEAFLDVTGSASESSDPIAIAHDIQRRIDEMGLSASVGVAASKTVAKIASDAEKPHGVTVVRSGDEAAFLAPLPVEALSGIGAATHARLSRFGVHTLGQLAALDSETVGHLLGRTGSTLVDRARGIDTSQVRALQAPKSVSHERTFSSDVSDPDEMATALRRLAERVGIRLREMGLRGRTVTVKLRYADFTTRTAQRTLEEPTDLEADFLPVASDLLAGSWTPGTGIRLLGIGMSGFDPSFMQMDLEHAVAAPGDSRRRALTTSMDEVRDRFGEDVVRYGMDEKGRASRRIEEEE